jgi:acetoin utilization protein AcuB
VQAARARGAGHRDRAAATPGSASMATLLLTPRTEEIAMPKAIPRIHEYMTPTPLTIGADQTLAQAHVMMREHGIRHLPVLIGGKLEGILSDRDLSLLETLRDVDPAKVSVEEAMTLVVYTVAPDAPLEEVAEHMAEHKLGSVVVLNGTKVAGVFTAVDGLRALAEVLRGHAKA